MLWHAIALLLWATGCRGHDPCCPAENIYTTSKHRCLANEGTEANLLLNCSDKGYFLMDPIEDAFNVSNEGHLMDLKIMHIAPPGYFCLTRLQREDGNLSMEMAALVCFVEDEAPLDDAPYFLYAMCLCVSAVFLLATLLVYLVLPQLRDLQGKTVMCAVASLCLGEIWIAVNQLHESGISNMVACILLAFLTYFYMMAAFFWMNIVSFNLWRSVVFRDSHIDECRLFTYYSFYGWGAPMVFLVAGIIAEHTPGDHIKPNFGGIRCWFYGSIETWSYFYGPIAVLMVCNAIFFVWTSWRLWKDYRNTSMPKLRAMRFKCLLYLKLFVIMGISWMFELLSVIFDGNSGFWIAMDIVNALQGIFIFVVVVLRKRVLKALVRSRTFGLPWPKKWATVVNEESESMLAEEMQLGSNNTA